MEYWRHINDLISVVISETYAGAVIILQEIPECVAWRVQRAVNRFRNLTMLEKSEIGLSGPSTRKLYTTPSFAQERDMNSFTSFQDPGASGPSGSSQANSPAVDRYAERQSIAISATHRSTASRAVFCSFQDPNASGPDLSHESASFSPLPGSTSEFVASQDAGATTPAYRPNVAPGTSAW